MSSVETATVNGPEKTAATPVGMVPHLKHLIESLPVCVMRTDLEGCLLAVNDCALHLLGVAEHAKVLSKSLTERISAEHLEEWRSFLQRGWNEGASSFECELIDFVGAHRIVLFKSVAQPPHADGIPSLILTAQDLASRRRLERALNDHQGCATTIDALQAELQQSEVERQKLVALVETLRAGSTGVPAEDHSLGEALRQQLAELEAATAAKDLEWHKRCDELSAQLASLEAERSQLAALIQERDAEQRRLTEVLARHDAEHMAAGETLQRRIAELERSLQEREIAQQQLSSDLAARIADHRSACETLHQRILELEHAIIRKEEEWRKRSDDLSAELAELRNERDRLSVQLGERAGDRQGTDASLAQRLGELERLLETNEAEWKSGREALRTQLDAHVAEHQRLTAQLKERDGEERRMFELLKDGDAEQQRLTGLVKAHQAEEQRLAQMLHKRDDEHQAAVDALQQQIEECERALSANDESWKQRCEELSNQLGAREDEGRARWEQLTAQLVEHANERQRLSKLVEEHEAEQRRLVAAHLAEKGQLEKAVREGEREHAEIDEGRRREIETVRLEMRQLAEDLHRTALELAKRTAEYETLTAAVHAREYEAIDPADVQRLMKSVAAYRVELVQVTENTIRTLEPMATAGRVAIASSRELQTAVEAVDDRSKQLLEQCALDDPNRAEIERLRRDSIGASSLVRQLLQVFGDVRVATHQG